MIFFLFTEKDGKLNKGLKETGSRRTGLKKRGLTESEESENEERNEKESRENREENRIGVKENGRIKCQKLMSISSCPWSTTTRYVRNQID